MDGRDLEAFNRRAARVQKTAQRASRLTRASAPRPGRLARLRRTVLTLLALAAALILAKGALIATTGERSWGDRVERLAAGDSVDRLIAVLLSPDAASLWLAERAAPYLAQLR